MKHRGVIRQCMHGTTVDPREKNVFVFTDGDLPFMKSTRTSIWNLQLITLTIQVKTKVKINNWTSFRGRVLSIRVFSANGSFVSHRGWTLWRHLANFNQSPSRKYVAGDGKLRKKEPTLALQRLQIICSPWMFRWFCLYPECSHKSPSSLLCVRSTWPEVGGCT